MKRGLLSALIGACALGLLCGDAAAQGAAPANAAPASAAAPERAAPGAEPAAPRAERAAPGAEPAAPGAEPAAPGAEPAATPPSAEPERVPPPLETPSPSGAAPAAELRAGRGDRRREGAWDPRRRFHLGAEALTDFPLQIGARIWGELPLRLRLSMTLGALPQGYLDAINGALVAGGVYDKTTADVIRGSLTSSFVFRLHGGWRPLPRRGLYFELGYGLLSLSGSVSTAMLSEGGVPVPAEAAGRAYQVHSLLHMFDAEIGWQWVVGRGFSIRAAAGVAATRSAQTRVSALTTDPAEVQAVALAAAYLDQVYTTYVITPTATLAAGWRFL